MCPPHLGRFSFGLKSFLRGLFPCVQARLAFTLIKRDLSGALPGIQRKNQTIK